MKLSYSRHWDWVPAILIFFMMQFATARLVVTRWTDFLYFAQTLAAFGVIFGLALGYSQFNNRILLLLTLGYSFTLIPWQSTLAINDIFLSDRLASVGGRLTFSLSRFFQGEAVEDGLLFVVFVSTIAWFLSVASSYAWTRHENYLWAVLPGGLFILVIHLYDNSVASRIWLLGFYILLALFLLGRLYYRDNRRSWQERRVFQMQESTFDLTRGMVIMASLLVFVAWTIPASKTGMESAINTWRRLTQPWRNVEDSLSHAVEGLEATYVTRAGELFSSQLRLGTGNPLSTDILFTVEVPDLPEKFPRFYWRGYVYDTYHDRRWRATESVSEEFSPENRALLIRENEERLIGKFIVSTQIHQSLLYTATHPVWVSRPGKFDYAPTDTGIQDLLAWRTNPSLSPGDQYLVTSVLNNPSILQLQNAGTNYPDWVEERYLQLPEDFSPRINELAVQITKNLDTPYDKAAAITEYLRSEIEYTNPFPEAPPEGADPIEWVLFDSKQGFCNYYASAEVLMLRSLGIPARMAVGFAEGLYDDEADIYLVRSLDSHAWPEVYFPQIGWVEFEPTGNQDPLVRRERSIEDDLETENEFEGGSSNSDRGLDEGILKDRLDSDENFLEAGALDRSPFANALSYSFFSIIFLIGLWFFNRRYAFIDQIPMRLKNGYERNGGKSPEWIANWASWATLTPIERSFYTINRSLRLLGENPAIHATPAARAKALTKHLPTAEKAIEVLSKQHHASLFTLEIGSARQARQASLSIWLYTIQVVIQRFIYRRQGKWPRQDKLNDR